MGDVPRGGVTGGVSIVSEGLPEPPASAVPAIRLYDHRSVGVATFFGSPLAGAALMAINYRRLGRSRAAAWAILAGLLATAALIALAMLTSSDWMKPLPIGLTFAMAYAAKGMQGAAIDQHVQQGGGLISRWAAFGIGMAGLVAVCSVIVAIVFVQQPSAPKKLIVGTKDEIYYSGQAKEADARALGKALQTTGFMADRGVSVFLNREQTEFTLSFVIKEGLWDDAATVAGFEQLTRDVAPALGGLPLKMRLLDTEENVKKESTVRQ